MERQTEKKKVFTLIGPKDHETYGSRWREKQSKSAFTLIELIVVMAVVGILVLLAAPKFLGYTQKAQETKHIHTAKVVETALEAYLIHGGLFPEDLEVVDEATLGDAIDNKTLIGVNGLIGSPDGETYYELTHDFIQKLDVKLSAKNELFIKAMASSVPTALYASGKGVTLIDKSKTLKGYTSGLIGDGAMPEEIDMGQVLEITGGYYHSFALMKDGTVRAWGRNDSGQLGLGDTTNREIPTQIPLLNDVKAIVAGKEHSIAVKNDGTVWTWGKNNIGQLGLGNYTNKYIPTKVSIVNVKDIATSLNHSMALQNDGTVWIWGENTWGQLGIGTKTSRTTPIKLALTSVKSIATGSNQSFALKEDGTVFAWGSNYSGELGIGNTTDKLIPTHVYALSDIESITSFRNHSFALTNSGEVYGWGQNDTGAVGTGDLLNKLSPVKLLNFNNVRNISAGYQHTLAVKEDGTAYGWGRNNFGVLGVTTATMDTNSPMKLEGLSNFKTITAKYYYTLAIKNDGTAWTWGWNQYGRLGDGTTATRTTPTIITIE